MEEGDTARLGIPTLIRAVTRLYRSRDRSHLGIAPDRLAACPNVSRRKAPEDHQVYWDHRGRKGRGDFRARKVCWGQKGTKVNLVLRDRVERKVTGVKWVYLDSLVSLVYRGFKVRPGLQVFRVVTVAMEQTVSLVREVIPERSVPAVFEVLLG